MVQQVEFVCWIRDSAGLDDQMTGSRSGPHMNTSNRKCAVVAATTTPTKVIEEKNQKNKKQAKRQVLAGFVNQMQNTHDRPSGYQPGITSIKLKGRIS
jgi:hypothetical protein